MTAGRLQVGSVIIVHRNGNEILDSKLDSLRRIKDNVKEVLSNSDSYSHSNRTSVSGSSKGLIVVYGWYLDIRVHS